MQPTVAKDSGFVDASATLFDADIDEIIDHCVYYVQVEHATYSVHNMETTVSASPPHRYGC
jgi:hypothetical protein